MKSVIQKSAIPESKAFVIHKLSSPYFDPVLHYHKEYQLFMVLEGTGTRFIGDSIKPFKENDIVFTGPDLPHLWRSDNAYFNKKNKLNTAGVVIYFRENFLGNAIQHKEELEAIYHLFKRSLRGLEIRGKTNRLVGKMMMQMLNLKGVASIIHLLKILDALASSDECLPVAQAGYAAVNKQTETDRMNKVYDYVMKHFGKKVSLGHVAELVSMTPTSFSRYFRSRVNKSFSDFLKEVRIEYACKLLTEQKININRVGYECGFPTLSNFNKQFKLLVGKTPLGYKNERLKMNTYADF